MEANKVPTTMYLLLNLGTYHSGYCLLITRFSASSNTSFPHLLWLLEAMLGNKQVSEHRIPSRRQDKFSKGSYPQHSLVSFMPEARPEEEGEEEEKHVTFIIFSLHFPDKSFEAMVASACE